MGKFGKIVLVLVATLIATVVWKYEHADPFRPISIDNIRPNEQYAIREAPSEYIKIINGIRRENHACSSFSLLPDGDEYDSTDRRRVSVFCSYNENAGFLSIRIKPTDAARSTFMLPRRFSGIAYVALCEKEIRKEAVVRGFDYESIHENIKSGDDIMSEMFFGGFDGRRLLVGITRNVEVKTPSGVKASLIAHCTVKDPEPEKENGYIVHAWFE